MEALRKEHFTMAVIPKYMKEEKLKYTVHLIMSLGHKLGKILWLMTGRIAFLNYLLFNTAKNAYRRFELPVVITYSHWTF